MLRALAILAPYGAHGPLPMGPQFLNLLLVIFIDDIISRRKTFYDNYKKLSTLPGFSYTFDDYCIIRSLVGSRNFGLNIGGDHVIAMVPLGDMFNHDIPADVKWSFDNSLDSYTMRANHSIKKGLQISDSYGPSPSVSIIK